MHLTTPCSWRLPFLFRSTFLIPAIAIGTLAGCVTDMQRSEFDESFCWSKLSDLAVGSSVTEGVPVTQALSRDANNADLPRRDRCEAISALFATFVKVGFSSEQMKQALPNSLWLEECPITPGGPLAGQAPVYVGEGSSWFKLQILPGLEQSQDWIIWLVLRHRQGQHPSPNEVAAFLKGNYIGADIVVGEFAIWHPIYASVGGKRIENVYFLERFTERGVGLRVLY